MTRSVFISFKVILRLVFISTVLIAGKCLSCVLCFSGMCAHAVTIENFQHKCLLCSNSLTYEHNSSLIYYLIASFNLAVNILIAANIYRMRAYCALSVY